LLRCGLCLKIEIILFHWCKNKRWSIFVICELKWIGSRVVLEFLNESGSSRDVTENVFVWKAKFWGVLGSFSLKTLKKPKLKKISINGGALIPKSPPGYPLSLDLGKFWSQARARINIKSYTRLKSHTFLPFFSTIFNSW